jgi:DNA-binding transcriptional regulator YhcF (GntR family)
MKIQIDRNLPITITEQIKGKIAYDIMCGNLEPGTPLPSVRELATRLEVAPMTVTRVYRELADEELIEAKPGVGTFVADVTRSHSWHTRTMEKSLHPLAERFLQQAMTLGYTPQDACQALQGTVDSHALPVSGPLLALVGNFRQATQAYAREIEAILHDLNAKVETVLLNDLRLDVRSVLPKLKGIRLVITVPTRLQEVRALLEPHGCEVVAVAFQVSSETRRNLASIPSDARVGVVATYPEFLASLLEGVVSYGILDSQPIFAYLEQEELVREMLLKVDVVVYASGSGQILEWLPDGVQAFEYRHVPDLVSLNRLRSLIID